MAVLTLCCGDPAEADSVQRDILKVFSISEASLTLKYGQQWKYEEFQKTVLRSQRNSSGQQS